MSKVRQNRRTDGVIEVGAILVGLVLVAYGLGMASWSSSSDSSTGFIDLSYGDPPYGFKETAWAEIVARPYFNGRAWILLGVVAALAGVAVLRRSAVMSVSAVWISLIAGVWTFAAVLALKLVDLQVGAYLPTIGHVIVAGVLVSVVAWRRWIGVGLLASAILAAAAGLVVWFLPISAFDSSCSLATQDRYDNQGACGDAISMLERWFVGLMLAAIVLSVSGVIVATMRPSPAREHQSIRRCSTASMVQGGRRCFWDGSRLCPPTMTHRRQSTIAVVLNMTDEAIGSGDSQRHGDLLGVAVFRGGKE